MRRGVGKTGERERERGGGLLCRRSIDYISFVYLDR